MKELHYRALSERAKAEQCQDLELRRRHLAKAMIVEELANYIGDENCLPRSFWQRLEKKRRPVVSHLRLVSSR